MEYNQSFRETRGSKWPKKKKKENVLLLDVLQLLVNLHENQNWYHINEPSRFSSLLKKRIMENTKNSHYYDNNQWGGTKNVGPGEFHNHINNTKTVLITNKSNRKKIKSDAPAADGEGGGVYRHGKTRYQYTKEWIVLSETQNQLKYYRDVAITIIIVCCFATVTKFCLSIPYIV